LRFPKSRPNLALNCPSRTIWTSLTHAVKDTLLALTSTIRCISWFNNSKAV